MGSNTRKKKCQALPKLQKHLNELIKYTYLLGLQDGRELWNENEETIEVISNNRIHKIISVLNNKANAK